MDANTQNISEATIALIDSLKSTTSHFGLANSGGEYKIITEMFLYKYFNDKFGYEAKRDKIYGERLSKADKWDAEYDKFTEEEVEDLFSYLPHLFRCLNLSIHWRICIILQSRRFFNTSGCDTDVIANLSGYFFCCNFREKQSQYIQCTHTVCNRSAGKGMILHVH